jgi:hypothetical protein
VAVAPIASRTVDLDEDGGDDAMPLECATHHHMADSHVSDIDDIDVSDEELGA